MLLGHRRHRDHPSSRKDEYKVWNHESDSDRQRQPSGTPHRYDVEYGTSTSTGHDRDRHHRSSKRADAANTSSAAPAPRSASHRHVSSTGGGNQAYAPQAQAQSQAVSGPPVASSSRTRTQDNTRGAYDMQAYLQKRADRRSPRSSEERLYTSEHGTTSRSATQQSRTAASPTTSTPQVPSSSQAYWVPPSQSTRDPMSSSRHHREREKESREQRRERKERERAIEEQERMLASGDAKHAEWSRDRPTTAESTADVDRARDHAADKEKGLERQRRREEKEQRREEREREKERERRREEREQERARRHAEKERSSRDRDNRPRDSSSLQYYAVYPTQTSAIPNTRYRPDERGSARHGPFLTDQIPSSSSNIALPATLHAQQSAYRNEGLSEPRKDESAPSPVPPQVPEKDRKHRSHRERALIQQAGQESGLSSSEQDLSGRERKSHRAAERRRATKELDGDAHPSGPSGSEAERMPERERRRTAQATGDGFYSYPNKSRDGRQQSMSYSQVPGSVPSGIQNSAPVGPIRSQHLAPPIVSIRAGQGPADPQTPLLRTKTPASTGQSRTRDQQPVATQTQSATAPAPATAALGYGSQSYNTSQTSFRPEGHVSQSYPVQQPSRITVPPPSQDAPRAQGAQPYYQHTAFPLSQQQPSAQYPGTSVQATTANGPTAYQTPAYSGAATHQPAPTQAVPYTNGNPYTTYQSATQNPVSTVPEVAHVSRTHVPPIPAKTPQPAPISKSRSGSSLRKVNDTHFQAVSSNVSQPPAHLARLSVYHSPGPAVSADLLLPVAVNPSKRSSGGEPTKTPRAPTQDLASRFPVHEDVLTSASSSTLAPGTGRSAANMLPGHIQHYAVDLTNQASSMSAVPARSSPYTSQSGNMPGAYDTGTPIKHPIQVLRSENETPIPVPAPKANASASQDPSAFQFSNQQPHPTRPQATPSQSKPPAVSSASAYAAANSGGVPHVSSKYSQQNTTQISNGMLAAGITSSSHSPRRKTSQQTLQRSPSIHLTPQLGPATPKHSPSARLAPRNGSTDTIQHISTKNSPNDPYRSLTQRNSNGSLRAPQPSSRIDTKSSRTPQTSEYPDSSRYRATAPTTYPANASQQHNNYPANTTSFSNYAHAPPPSTHHSRSTSQPANQSSSYEYQASTQRSHTVLVAPTVTPSPASAPSASALAAAYRNGVYSADYPSRPQEAPPQRVPPRSAPSPAPSIAGRPYAPAPSMLSKSGFATSTALAQPLRSQTHPTPTSRPLGTPALASHARSVSDPQFARVAISGHPSTPAPPKAQLAYHPSPSEQELLKTPSSIARSVSKGSQLPPPSGRVVGAPSMKSTKDKGSRVRSMFGFLRSRSSPPKEEGVSISATVPVKTRQRSTSQTTLTAVAASVRNIVAPHPAPSRAQASSRPSGPPAQDPASDSAYRQDRRRAAEHPKIVAPVPLPASDPSVQLAQGASKAFTPFRLLSRRHHPVSEASVEAQDGTATNTVIGAESARSSTAGRPSPPLRDPMEAARTWRNNEEQEQTDRGTWRRRRPGVVFDVEDDFTETETHNPVRKPGRR